MNLIAPNFVRMIFALVKRIRFAQRGSQFFHIVRADGFYYVGDYWFCFIAPSHSNCV